MAVRFVIGRAGTGKTHHCLEAIRERLRQDPLDGPRLILLVPEQAALQMERALLSPREIPAAHRAEVLSFQRLAFKVLETAGRTDRRAITETARTMILRHLLAERAGTMRYYRRLDRLGGFLERLGETITELIAEAVPPSALALGRAAVGEVEPVQAAKLHDLRQLYQAYLDYLGTDRLDPSQNLEVAREHLAHCGWLTGAEIWVDGFASLSRQETLTLVALARLGRSMDITLLADPRLWPAGGHATADPVGFQLFRKTLQTHEDLCRAFEDAGVALEAPLPFRGGLPPRFREQPSLARLERSLFDHHGVEAGSAPAAVELIQLPSRRLEVEYAVSRICRWVQDPRTAWRYRDLAIIVRDLEPYHDLLSAALQARGIPFFVDRRRPTVHHPLVELLRSGTALAAERLSLDAVRLVLKTGMLPLGAEAIDELENYLIAHGISGIQAWGEPWTWLNRSSFVSSDTGPAAAAAATLVRVNDARCALLQQVLPWLDFAGAPDGHTGAAWAEGISEWLVRLDAGRTLARWTEEAEGRGDQDSAAEHRQVWRDVVTFLDDLAFAFAEIRLAAEELAEVLTSGLARLTLGLAPPMVDQLLVGSIERSRHPDIKAAVILGFNDGVFPARIVEDAMLNDDDRRLLRRHDIRVGPPARERVLDEALLLYVTLTRASHALVVTCAATGNDGKAMTVSPYVSALQAALPGLTLEVVGDPLRQRRTWDIQCPRDLSSRLVTEFRSRPDPDRDDPALRSRWNELYDAARPSLAADPACRRAFRALHDDTRAGLSAGSIARLTGPTLRTSVSRLETFAACPFQYFARYVLSLQEREEATLQAVDVGQVHHAILEDFTNVVSAAGLKLAQLDEGTLLARLDESCRRVALRLPPGGTLSNARNAYLLRRSRTHLARVLRTQREASARGAARPRANELAFGFDRAGGLPGLRLETPAGRHVELRGFIDRVDLAELGDELLGIVIDYKRTRDKRLSLSEVYHGLSLQLLGYLLALAEHGESLAGRPIRPIAALYVSLASQLHKVDHPNDAGDREEYLRGTFPPRGIFLADTFEALDATAGAGRSAIYNFFRTKEGGIGNVNASDAADRPSFQALLAHTRSRLGALADRILDGCIDVSPYRLRTFSPCSWCTMGAVCRFEMGISDVRFLESLKRSEVFERLTARPAAGG